MKGVIAICLFIYSSSWAWQYVAQKDPMTDKTTLIWGIDSTNNTFVNKKSTLGIYYRCDSKEWQLILIDPYIIGDGPVNLRVDKGEPIQSYAAKSADGKQFFIGDTYAGDKTNPKKLIDKIQKGKILLVRYNRVNDEPIDAVFNVSNLQLKTKCN